MVDNHVTRQEWEATNKAIADLTTTMYDEFQDLRRSLTTPTDPTEPNEHMKQQGKGDTDPSSNILDNPVGVYQHRPLEKQIRIYQRRNKNPFDNPPPPGVHQRCQLRYIIADRSIL